MKKHISILLVIITLVLASCAGGTNTDIPDSQSQAVQTLSDESTDKVQAAETTVDKQAGTAVETSAETTPVSYPVIPVTPTIEEARHTVLDYMIAMSEVKWTCTQEIDFSKEKSYTGELYYHAGADYVGMPYVSHHSGIAYFEINFLDSERRYTGPVTYADMPGVTCAVSCFTSFRLVSYRTRGSGTGTITPYSNSGMVKVGDYICTSDNTKTVVTANTADTMLESYALMKVADVLTKRQDTGHSRMVYSEPVVVRKADGKIDPKKSTVALIEQCSSFNKEITEYNTTWKVNKTYTFEALFKDYYIPSRLAEFDSKLDDARVTVSKLTTKETLTGDALSGAVTSNFVILYTEVKITDAAGNTVSESLQAKDYSNNTTSFTVNLADKKLTKSVKELPAGKYHFKASAFIGYGECILGEFDFTVS